MSESRAKKKRILAADPCCYFCDGKNRATTIDHVPPRACFPDGYAPEGFEFPACKACNEGATKQDQIFGFYSMLLDFDHSKLRHPEWIAKLDKLRRGIRNNYLDALPDEAAATYIYDGHSVRSSLPTAVSFRSTSPVKEALTLMGKKLTHALYLKESGKRLTVDHLMFAEVYQPQHPGTETLTDFFTTLLPNLVVGRRSNISDYGERFRYVFGLKPENDFFIYAAQFGLGLIVWGIVRKSDTPLPLRSAAWVRCACGAGAYAS